MNEMFEKVKPETASEMLIRVLGEFSKDEPVDAIICWTTEGKRLGYHRTSMDDYKAIGMLEVAKTIITDDTENEDDNDQDEE
jgi:hypothetical protein